MSEDVRQIFHEQLVKYMKLNNKTQSDLARDLNISLNTISGWYHGKTFPRPDKMQIIADYLGIRVEDLINKNDDNNDTLSENVTFKSELQKETIVAIRRATDDLSDEKMNELLEILNFHINRLK